MFPVPSYIEYLARNKLQDNKQSREDFEEYSVRFKNLETVYYSLVEKLGIN